jgi:hypothetical protein
MGWHIVTKIYIGHTKHVSGPQAAHRFKICCCTQYEYIILLKCNFQPTQLRSQTYVLDETGSLILPYS